MKRLIWRIKGWRRVYSGVAFVDPRDMDRQMSELFPSDMQAAIARYGGAERTRVTACLMPFGAPMVQFEVWGHRHHDALRDGAAETALLKG